jgi:acetyl-CoA carboxylase carboxyltransferase component
VDDVIEPNEMRERLATALNILSGKRVKRYPNKKHGNMPM